MLVPTLAVMEAIVHGNDRHILENLALTNLDGGIAEQWQEMAYTQGWAPDHFAMA